MNMTAKNICRILVWVPVLVMLVVIFGFSGQDGKESGNLSRKVAEIVIDSCENMNIIHLDEAEKYQYIEKLQFPIRKCAHMTEYAILTLFIYVALLVNDLRMHIYLINAIMVLIFASLDEFHQVFVPERCGTFKDVIIDMCGAGICLLIIYLVSLLDIKGLQKM